MWYWRACNTLSGRLVAGILRDRGGVSASVVIATHNRASYLNLTLAALERQHFPAGAWEIVVADAGSSDDTADTLVRCQRRRRVELVPVRVAAVGRAHALNEAVRAARGRIVVFLGDDRLVGPDFLLRHLLRQAITSGVVLGDSHRWIHTHLVPVSPLALAGVPGRAGMDPEELDQRERWVDLVFDQGEQREPLYRYFARHRVSIPFPWVSFDSGNASVAREVIMGTTGFDERFPGWDVEVWGLAEKELAYRLHRSATLFHFVPGAWTLRQVCHVAPPPPSERLRNLGYLFGKHPELRCAAVERLLL
jgi:glycosyltransferase involved in cell wall biosynthesis